MNHSRAEHHANIRILPWLITTPGWISIHLRKETYPAPILGVFMNAAKGASRPTSLEEGSLIDDESAKTPIKRSAEKKP